MLSPDADAGQAPPVLEADGHRDAVLADVAFHWELDVPVSLSLVTVGSNIRAEADGQTMIDITDEERPLLDGAIALVMEEGTLSTNAVRVTPVF